MAVVGVCDTQAKESVPAGEVRTSERGFRGGSWDAVKSGDEEWLMVLLCLPKFLLAEQEHIINYRIR
jgi:hypothetical protein